MLNNKLNKNLKIIGSIIEKKLSILKKDKKIGDNNLILLFYHELMYFFCTEYLENKISSNKKFYKKNYFLCRDDKYIFEKKKTNTLFKIFKKLFNLISLFIDKFTKKKILIYGFNLSFFDYLKFIIYTYSKGYSVFFINNPKLRYIEVKYQRQIVIDLMLEIRKKFQLKFNTEKFIINLDYGIKKLKLNELEKKNKKKTYLITSNVASIYNRLFALSGYKKKNHKTILFFHSDEMGAVSQYAWRYDDLSTCDILVGYGRYGDFKKNKDKNLKSLNDQPRIIYTNSEECQNIFNSRSLKKSGIDIKNSRGLYISAKIKKIDAIQPDHFIIDPQKYIQWQDYLFKNMDNLDFKEHPKQKLVVNYNFVNKKLKSNSLQNIYKDYDFFVFDYVSSSAFQVLASTNKPIIYYDIGLSKLSNLGDYYLNKRVKNIKVNIYKNFKGFHIPSKVNLKTYDFNSYTRKFSLPYNKSIKRWQLLINKVL
jgi:hypothetical protein